MRIMATSDLHGNLEGLNPKGADVVVLAGDVAPLRGRGPWHINDQKKWINKKFREWASSYPDIQFVVIPGNHDFYPIAHILYRDHHPVTFTCHDGSTTAIYNVSRLDERYEVAYEPTWLEV